MVKRSLRMDNLGRMTIPKDIRTMLHLNGREVVDVVYDETRLVIPKVDILDIEESMDRIIKIAGNSGAITNKEFDELDCILDKLREEILEES